MLTTPYYSANFLAYVDLPDPGGPSMMILGGFLGHVLLYLSLSILERIYRKHIKKRDEIFQALSDDITIKL